MLHDPFQWNDSKTKPDIQNCMNLKEDNINKSICDTSSTSVLNELKNLSSLVTFWLKVLFKETYSNYVLNVEILHNYQILTHFQRHEILFSMNLTTKLLTQMLFKKPQETFSTDKGFIVSCDYMYCPV